MKIGQPQRGTLVPALMAFMVLAGVGVSLAARPDPAPESSPPVIQVRSGHRGDEGPARSSSAPTEDQTDPGAFEEPPSACVEALDAGKTAIDRERGLDRAIEVILENCGRHPAADGLLNALERLRANQERKDARDHGGTPNANANDHATAETSPGGSDQAGPKEKTPPSNRGRGNEQANANAGTGAVAA